MSYLYWKMSLQRVKFCDKNNFFKHEAFAPKILGIPNTFADSEWA